MRCSVSMVPNGPVAVSPALRHALVGFGVTIRSRSENPIKAVNFQLTRTVPGQEKTVSTERVPIALNPGRTGQVDVPVPGLRQGSSRRETLVMTIVSVEFSDGTTWTLPQA
jgi:hypothetical protein